MRILSPSVRRGYTAWKNYSERTKRVIGHRLAILEHAETDGDEEKDRGTAGGNERLRNEREVARSWGVRRIGRNGMVRGDEDAMEVLEARETK